MKVSLKSLAIAASEMVFDTLNAGEDFLKATPERQQELREEAKKRALELDRIAADQPTKNQT
jgi:hypothetical protein